MVTELTTQHKTCSQSSQITTTATQSAPSRTGKEQATGKAVDLIWNVTLICPWPCGNCCVDAVQVTKRDGQIYLRSHALTKVEVLSYDAGHGTLYDQAMALRQRQGLELDLAGKLRVLDHLEGYLPKIDFSGGDPLAAAENWEVMRRAAQRFGREQITLTATGAGLAKYDPKEITPWIGELNFTYDTVSAEGSPHRSAGYADGNLRKAAQFARAGVRTRAECPLSVHNSRDESLRRLYADLHEEGIETLLVMRLFPVGRGTFVASDIPTPAQYRRAMSLLREIEARFGRPKVKLQCALRFFDTPDMAENPCDLVRESFGLMADGTLLASPWAIGPSGGPLHDVWVLGNLATTPLREILRSEKVQQYAARLNDNFGHCKIFSFLNSRKGSPLERVFDKADPLYTPAEDHLSVAHSS